MMRWCWRCLIAPFPTGPNWDNKKRPLSFVEGRSLSKVEGWSLSKIEGSLFFYVENLIQEADECPAGELI